jgi:hypothetical protein
MDMYLFPRELDFDARRTGLISKQDKVIASNTYDHPEFRSKVSVKVKIRTWGRGAPWGNIQEICWLSHRPLYEISGASAG